MTNLQLSEHLSENYRLTDLLSRYLQYAPDAITPEMIRSMTALGMDKVEAFAYLLGALFELDLEREGKDRAFFRSRLLPSLRLLDPAPYENDPYFKSIAFPETRLGNWELKTITYPAYRAFVCDDPVMQEGIELQRIGFFDRDYSFPAVLEDQNEWMTLTPVDMDTCQSAISQARGNCITFGLGLGYYAFSVTEKEQVDTLTIVERSPDVISLFESVLFDQFPHKDKIRIICDDAFSYAEHKMPLVGYDHAFVDTWRDAGDGMEHYLRMKPLEKKNGGTVFSYWIEDTILSRMRAFVCRHEMARGREADDILALCERESLRRLAADDAFAEMTRP